MELTGAPLWSAKELITEQRRGALGALLLGAAALVLRVGEARSQRTGGSAWHRPKARQPP
ncbi:hypothetical protein AB0M39_30790 [Streptomyces sp. NPDC051907]|uniref:hypothetical protein n=1 Tax=Streptomyces sp. NPDC051907 TaxID=3155284 RepID=UPI003419A581